VWAQVPTRVSGYRHNGPVEFTDSDLDPALAVRLRPAGRAPDGRPLITAVAQDAESGRVLMVAWMDGEALARTLATGHATYYSRSRQELWVKGATSGHTQQVVEAALDCDGDAVLLRVRPAGPACHTGMTSCFDTLTLPVREAA
jgi:phosphoribosyl-AMP cyclohydrolase